jgi:Protein of unknown function (DUF1579)
MSHPRRHRTRNLTVAATLLALAVPAIPASAQPIQDPLLENLIGEWVLEGTIGGEQTTHDVAFEWVLQHQYVQMHEIAREKDAAGRPAYEALVTIGWDEPSQRYACLWLDSTGGGGLVPEGLGYAAPSGDSIPFQFRFPDGSPFHTTFVYHRGSDTWEWQMDGENEDGTLQPFARVTLSRKGGSSFNTHRRHTTPRDSRGPSAHPR